MQKMGTLRKITGRRRAPPEHMGDRAITRFQKYWSGLYDGPPLERTQGISLHLTSQEVKMLIKSLPNKKAPGPDTITAEMLKYGGPAITKMMKKMLNTMLE
jgi:hypothetical protein